MDGDKIICVKVYLKHHLFASYKLAFSSKENVEKFVDYINNDVDFVQIGLEVIRRKSIRKLVIKDE